MIQIARRLRTLAALAVALCTGLGLAAPTSAAPMFQQAKYAAIVVDASTGEVLYARRADQPRYPASITKIMTLYLTFEALAAGRLKLTDQVPVSAHAAAQPPTKLGLRPGQSLPVDEAIRVVALKSANDIAVALAEKVAGSEPRFTALMTLRAHELGMSNTRFVNANGLPDSRHVTTARDIAILSRAVMRDYPQYYSYFGQKTYDWHGQRITNHNALLSKMPGVDGLKTGYTNAAGFTLAASAVRNNRRLIAVVLGGQSTAARDQNVEDLLDAGFDVLAKRKLGQNISIAANLQEPDDISGPVLRAPTEMGDATQDGLKVELTDFANLRGSQAAAPASPFAVASITPGALPSTWSQNSSLKAQTAALTTDSSNCEPVRTVRTKTVKIGKGRRAKFKKVQTVSYITPKGCAAEPAQAVAKADCVKPKARKGRKVKAPACMRGSQVASKDSAEKAAGKKADAALKADAGGRYLIQVGAFKSQADAKAHLAKVSKRYGGVVSAASSQVQSAGGNYRARFRGFSAEGAKAACQALSAKGERCLVLSGG
jgi:D-alanyl-D-alanine carboxypeptidase (penicillin-binding protein 5/6)